MNEEIKIFYSWQSDLPPETNQRGIFLSIGKSKLNIENDNENLKLLVDEATRDVSGSPDIPTVIFDKITNSDIFICDVTTINSESMKRKTPNPNVMIELGYAVAELGWDRIIMVFNKNHGTFPHDLPFDMEKRRVIVAEIKGKEDSNGKGDLTLKLQRQILSIIENKPLRPFQKRTKKIKEIYREKDITNIVDILSYVNIESIDEHIDSLPYKFSNSIFFYKESIDEIYNSTSFYLYDNALKNHLKGFIDSLKKTLNHYQHFNPSSNKKYFHFNLPFDTFESPEAENSFNILCDEKTELDNNFKRMIEYLRLEYIEIDVDEISKKAYKNYLDYAK